MATGRPSISPTPVTTPSAARNRSPRPASMWSASIPYSTQVPGSTRRSRRSRTVSLPSECCRSTRSGPPISRARSRRVFRSPTSGPQSWTSPPPVVTASPPSSPLPLRLALLGERGDALAGVLGGGPDREHGLEVRERIVGAHVEHVVEALPAPAEDQRRLRRQRRRQLVHRGVELGDGHDAGDEPDALGFGGVDAPARHHQLEYPLRRHRPK